MDWIGLAKDRNRWRAVVNSVLNLQVPSNAGKLSSWLTSSCLSSAQLHRVSKYAYWEPHSVYVHKMSLFLISFLLYSTLCCVLSVLPFLLYIRK
jgi:hypothetical protein